MRVKQTQANSGDDMDTGSKSTDTVNDIGLTHRLQLRQK